MNYKLIEDKNGTIVDKKGERYKMSKLKLLELFGGIGACSQALEQLGIDFEIVDYVDNDKFAVRSFNAIHNTHFEEQDITQWDKQIDVDLIMHGSPCQDFSLAGLQAGGDEGSGTRSSLMYETLRIVEKLRPKYVIWENVKNIISKKHVHNFNNYINRMSEFGYKSFYKVLNAKDYGIPQNRERVFTISTLDKSNYEFPKPIPLKLKLKDMLEDNVDEKYYLSNQAIHGRLTTNYQKYKLEDNVVNDKEIHPTILARFKGAPTLYINNNTKQGYLEATEGDGVDISSRMQHHRGTVQKGIIQTLDSQGGNSKGVVIKNMYSNEEMKLFTEDGNIKRYVDSNIIDEFKEGQMATTSFPNGYGHGPRTHDESIALNTIDKPSIKQNLKIRKLTPRECWRLMGFSDEAFDRAAQINSNSQLYKQAGNSIVVNVLTEVLRNLLILKGDSNE